MKIFSALLLALFSFNSHAGELSILTVEETSSELSPSSISTVLTKHDQLLADFQGAAPADPLAIAGFWTGRCYQTTTPNVPFGQLLGTVVRTTSKHGPHFPGEVVVNMGVITMGTNPAPDAFDNLSPTHEAALDQYSASSEFKALVAQLENGSLVSRAPNGLQFSVRTTGSIHFAQLTTLRENAGLPAGSTFGMCYFFKKVH
jgi:hypothetical protein